MFLTIYNWLVKQNLIQSSNHLVCHMILQTSNWKKINTINKNEIVWRKRKTKKEKGRLLHFSVTLRNIYHDYFTWEIITTHYRVVLGLTNPYCDRASRREAWSEMIVGTFGVKFSGYWQQKLDKVFNNLLDWSTLHFSMGKLSWQIHEMEMVLMSQIQRELLLYIELANPISSSTLSFQWVSYLHPLAF